MLSVSGERAWRCKPGCRAINYDEYYIIFGNSEMRLKCNEDRVFSNFGISNSYYEVEGAKVV